MSGTPLVTVVIPVRNEEHRIAACLEHLAAQDHSLDRMEVIVVDGGSDDRTVDVVARAAADHPELRLRTVVNGPGTIARNLNAGLAAAEGEVLCRVDAKSRVPPDYVRRCVAGLAADPARLNVGGLPLAVTDHDGTWARAIARSYNNRWTTGLSKYKRGAPSGRAESVYLGTFPVDRLRELGGWDERLQVNEDFELNQRLGRAGTVWFEADLVVGHVHGSASVVDIFERQRRLGHGKARYWRLTGGRPQPRQWMLLAGPPAAGAAVLAWVAAGRRPTHRLGLAVTAGSAALLALEALGTDDPPVRGVTGHVAGAVACAAVGVGWLVGVAEGVASGGRR